MLVALSGNAEREREGGEVDRDKDRQTDGQTKTERRGDGVAQ